MIQDTLSVLADAYLCLIEILWYDRLQVMIDQFTQAGTVTFSYLPLNPYSSRPDRILVGCPGMSRLRIMYY
jgi:hypothetical protein